jgi:hypothetical protein
MIRLLLALVLCTGAFSHAHAQTARAYGPLGYCQVTSLATVKSLVSASCSTGAVPAAPFIAEVCVSGAPVRYTTSPTTTPTATIGIPVVSPSCFQLSVTTISLVQFIQQSLGAVLDIEFFQ